jgi:hypothetical protein
MLYNYALRLLDFSYQPEGTKKGKSQTDGLASTYFIILSQGKIREVSNQLLLELRVTR